MFEPPKDSHIRRSKLEMICDVLSAIADGTDAPTRIMYRANLTWSNLVAFLETLERHQMLSKYYESGRIRYKLTNRGFVLANLYNKLREEGKELEEETMSYKQLKVARAAAKRDEVSLSPFVEQLKKTGFKALGMTLVGRSGSRHAFNALVEATDGTKHAFLVYEDVDYSKILASYVAQLDTNVRLYIVHTGKVDGEAQKLAASYSLELIQFSLMSSFARRLAIRSAASLSESLLLEVDPSSPYESVVRELVTELVEKGDAVYAFTSMSSPVYGVLSPLSGIRLYVLTTKVSHVTQTGREDEVMVPEHDSAVLLHVLEELAQSNEKRVAIVFDNVSDMMVALGFERAHAFFKEANAMMNKFDASLICLFEQNMVDERTVNLIRGLFLSRAVIDSSGIRIPGS